MNDLQELLNKPAFRKRLGVLIPDADRVEKLVKSAMMVVTNPGDIQRCSPESIQRAVINAAEIGLDFVKSKGEAYLVPQKDWKTQEVRCEFWIGYQGLVKLMRRAGATNIYCELRREHDKFERHVGTDPYVSHYPSDEGGRVVGAYAVVMFSDPGWRPQSEYMSIRQLEAVRAKAKSQKGPWGNESDREEMYRKTVIRRLAKYVPQSEEMARAMEIDNSLYHETQAEENERLSGTLSDVIRRQIESVQPSIKETRQNEQDEDLQRHDEDGASEPGPAHGMGA